MKDVQKGDPFNLTTKKQKKAGRLVIKSLRNGQSNKSRVVEEITDQVYDCKATSQEFISNMVKSSNHFVTSVNRFYLALEGKKKVMVGEK